MLRGVLRRRVFASPDSGYAVVALEVPNSMLDAAMTSKSTNGSTTMVTVQGKGGLGMYNLGEDVEVRGSWMNHPTYGRQLVATSTASCVAQSQDTMKRYLSSGEFKGVGPKLAERIVAHFGDETIQILNQGKFERLAEVPGISLRIAANVRKSWESSRSTRDLIMFLQRHDLPLSLAPKLQKKYGSAAVDKVSRNPYRLSMDIRGVGFLTADSLAQRMGIAWDSEDRMRAALLHSLDTAAKDGHTCSPHAQVVKSTISTLLEASQGHQSAALVFTEERLSTMLTQLVGSGVAIGGRTDGPEPLDMVSSPGYYLAEQALAARIALMLRAPTPSTPGDYKAALQTVLTDANRTDSPSVAQLQAVKAAMLLPFSVITGGPGTGKTYTTRTVVEVWRKLGFEVALACPTARAAHRLNDVLTKDGQGVGGAMTIHRLLGFGREWAAVDSSDASTSWRAGFLRHPGNPLSVDVLLVDEASMLDTQLAAALLEAVHMPGDPAVPRDSESSAPPVRPIKSIVFVGDVDQLPSVGAGRVLADMVQSGHVHVTRLDQVFRQADESCIVKNAHAVNQGHTPKHFATPDELGSLLRSNPSKDSTEFLNRDCVWVDASYPEDALTQLSHDVISLVRACGWDPLHDLQVLAPMRKGALGTDVLNACLQKLLVPGGKPVTAGSRLRVGDRVMQQVNNYDLGVINGDTGTVLGATPDNQHVIVAYEDDPDEPATAQDASVFPCLGPDGRRWEFPHPVRLVRYTPREATNQLDLAYAITVHKAQGNEWPVVVLVMHQSHYIMLSRGLLYTALARAQQLSVVMSTRKALGIAVHQTKDQQRHTQLRARLAEAVALPDLSVFHRSHRKLPDDRSASEAEDTAVNDADSSGASEPVEPSVAAPPPKVAATRVGRGTSPTSPTSTQIPTSRNPTADWDFLGVGSVIGAATTPIAHASSPAAPKVVPSKAGLAAAAIWSAYGLEDALHTIMSRRPAASVGARHK